MRNLERRTPHRERLVVAAILITAAAAIACGKKGPPLAPLHLVPAPPASLKARVIGNTVYLTTVVPSTNTTGRDAVAIDRLEVYAVTIAAGSTAPPNRELLSEQRAIGRIAIKPPPDPDAPVDETAPKDTRPAPGETVSFVEQVGPSQLRPDEMPQPKAPPKSAAGTASAVASPPADTLRVATRFYTVRGLTKNGRPGPASSRVAVPLVAPPPAPGPMTVTYSEQAVSLTWTPPADAVTRIALTLKPGVPIGAGQTVDPDAGLPDAVPPTWVPSTPVYEVPPLSYNVYAVQAAAAPAAPAEPRPLNEQPLTEATLEHPGAQPGKEQCFTVRSVQVAGDVSVESAADAPVCVTPKDTFPPAAPTALAAVAGAGGINLIWDANTEPDLAGYVVLRGEAPGDTLQPLTPQPIHETRYVDAAARPGVQYAYAVVAVDTAGNRSANSNKVIETAR